MTTIPESFEFPLPPALTLALVVAEFLKHFASNFGFELRSGSSVFVKFEDLELLDPAFFFSHWQFWFSLESWCGS